MPLWRMQTSFHVTTVLTNHRAMARCDITLRHIHHHILNLRVGQNRISQHPGNPTASAASPVPGFQTYDSSPNKPVSSIHVLRRWHVFLKHLANTSFRSQTDQQTPWRFRVFYQTRPLNLFPRISKHIRQTIRVLNLVGKLSTMLSRPLLHILARCRILR